MTTTDPTTTPADPPADPPADDPAGTVYVCLRKVDAPEFIMRLAQTDAERDELEKMAPFVSRLVNAVVVWRELGTVTGASRDAAWQNAQRDYAQDMPADVGAQGQMQLVPQRFWRTITLVVEQPPPQLRVDGV